MFEQTESFTYKEFGSEIKKSLIKNALKDALKKSTSLYIKGENKVAVATVFEEDQSGRIHFVIWPQDSFVNVTYSNSALPDGDSGDILAAFSIERFDIDAIVELTYEIIEKFVV